MLFVGSGTAPNLDGLEWFLSTVWVMVRAEFPQAQFRICGSVCDLLSNTGDGVSPLGRVPDLTPEYARATLSVAPLLCGSGLENQGSGGLGHGRAVVGTPIALQGLADYDWGLCNVRGEFIWFCPGSHHLVARCGLPVET